MSIVPYKVESGYHVTVTRHDGARVEVDFIRHHGIPVRNSPVS